MTLGGDMMFKDSTILITGGTGSLGSEIGKQLLEYKPQTLRIYARGEYLHFQMSRKFTQTEIRYLVGDVRDYRRLSRAMNGVDFVFHCAALKHVHICEFNPIEAVRTNIDGTINVIDCAINNGVEKVLAVSTDKAVHPINLYGATKLVMEKLICHANVYGKTNFSCVRMGNLMGSSGSLFPLIYESIENKTPIKLTHKDMARYWMTLEHGAKFCIDSLKQMDGGEIFIPKMPELNVKEFIETLAGRDVKLEITGKKKGEKLQEMLISEDEQVIDKGDYYLIKIHER